MSLRQFALHIGQRIESGHQPQQPDNQQKHTTEWIQQEDSLLERRCLDQNCFDQPKQTRRRYGRSAQIEPGRDNRTFEQQGQYSREQRNNQNADNYIKHCFIPLIFEVPWYPWSEKTV